MSNDIFEELKRFREDRKLDLEEFDLETYLRKDYEETFELMGLPDFYCKDMAKRRAKIDVDFLSTDQRILDNKIKLFSNSFVRADAMGDKIVFAVEALEQQGFDANLLLLEVAKEINSREGEIVDGKFEKFRTPEAEAKWYKADFHKAIR